MTPDLKLVRFDYNPLSTAGRLYFAEGEQFVYTLEPPWVDNEPFVSCIPEGYYRIKRDTFKGKYPNFRLTHVLGHTDVEMHRGNTPLDTKGCILVGDSLEASSLHGWAIPYGTTEAALTRLMETCTFTEGILVVTSSSGRPV